MEVPFFVIAPFDVHSVELGENPPVRSEGRVEEQPSLGSAAAGPWPDEVRQVGAAAAVASDDEIGEVTGPLASKSTVATSSLSSAAAGRFFFIFV